LILLVSDPDRDRLPRGRGALLVWRIQRAQCLDALLDLLARLSQALLFSCPESIDNVARGAFEQRERINVPAYADGGTRLWASA
jgi:hypothetical protein